MSVDLGRELSDSNKRVMAVQTNVLDQIGGQIQFGKRVDLFWVAISVIVAGVIVATSIFGKRKRKRR